MKIHSGQLDYLGSQVSQELFGQSLVILLISILLFKTGFPGKIVYAWDICTAALLIYRYFSFMRFRPGSSLKSSQQVTRKFNESVISALLLGLLWSILFAKVISHTSPEFHFLVMTIGIGLSGAAIVTLGSIFLVYVAFISPITTTLVGAFYLQGDYIHIAAAMAMMIGISYMLYTAHKYSLHLQLMLQKTEQLKETEIEALVCLGKAGEYRDSDTGDHVLRVGYSSYLLAKSAGFSEQDAKTLMYASPLHDLGKIGIPDHLLRKPEGLTDAEFNVMKEHTRIGANILKNSKSKVMKMAKVVALSHHEKWDGSGYPAGLSGTGIPIEGRIVAICDVYDALTSYRPYKKIWTDNEAMDFLRKNANTHFDPSLVELFIRNIPEVKKFAYQLEDHVAATGIHPIAQLTQPA